MPGPMHFDARAELYERARPPYPEALWGRLRALGLLRPGAAVLELGAGSGQATRPLVENGAEVTAVEPGAALAARLRRRVPAARVLEDTAEAVVLPAAAFDLAVVATAAHWLDLDVVLPKVHRALRPGGSVAVWRNVFGDPTVSTPFRRRVDAIVAERDDPPRRDGPGELDVAGWVDRLTTGGAFRHRHTARIRWSIDLTADEVRDLFTTFSDWTAAEADAAARAVDDLGGIVTEHYGTWLIVLTRMPARAPSDPGQAASAVMPFVEAMTSRSLRPSAS